MAKVVICFLKCNDIMGLFLKTDLFLCSLIRKFAILVYRIEKLLEPLKCGFPV